ncbi:hypothetical protein AB1226_001024 [Salmonella enterica subsp. enterica]|nr:hypothetical protein [Salmonella enterica subsp. enterica serovar Colorado]EAT2666439.1 hypothetical protein [Salmonella enterica]EBF9479484.1 hypothetical protein [Salmonella enterica subsp. enterica serovar Nigeria]EBW2326147.1 hypothetical protein [Salmonella enterica subsp. enterica serovar Agoueve]EBW9543007.1 hypothetical protein [Salmonella enterica subsp. enterica serovar Mississippi]ECD7290841.1 hypothetical protein [Salmonella enterica subsp. enterica serovar Agbeni]ECE5859507.1 
MALEDDDLISIDALTPGTINNTASTIPSQLGVHMTQGNQDPVYSLPYQHTQPFRIYDLEGDGTTWSRVFQYPKQRLILDIEMSALDTASNMGWQAAILADYEIQTTGVDCCGMYIPLVPAATSCPTDIYGLTVNTPKVKSWFTGEQYRLGADGRVIIPVRIMFLSTSPLKTTENSREITIKIVRKTTSYRTFFASGVIHVNPLPSAADIAFCS